MTDTDRMLVEILATVDVIFLPIRRAGWNNHTPVNLCFARQRMKDIGVPVRTGGDASHRKTGERTLARLQAAGFISRHPGRATKFPHVRLTAAGEARARALCGLPGRGVGRMFLDAIAAESRVRDPLAHRTLDEIWIPETRFNWGQGWDGTATTAEAKRGLGLIEQDYLPAGRLGWVTAWSSVQGHAYYSVAEPEGWREIDEPSVAPDVGELPDPDDEAIGGLYRQSQDAFLASLAADKPEVTTELGDVPLPVSIAGIGYGQSREERGEVLTEATRRKPSWVDLGTWKPEERRTDNERRGRAWADYEKRRSPIAAKEQAPVPAGAET